MVKFALYVSLPILLTVVVATSPDNLEKIILNVCLPATRRRSKY